MLFGNLADLFSLDRLITLAILFLTSMPVHEWAHAFAAYRLGDDTAAMRGRLTLNPLAHLDPLGTIGLVLFGYGWGKPVPVSPYRLRGNMRASWALVSAAGPFSNLVLAMLAAIPFRLGWLSLGAGSSSIIDLSSILLQFILINLSLMLFNLIPIPPLDGSRILAWILPRQGANLLYQLERYGGIGLTMVLFLLSRLGFFSLVMYPAMLFIVRALLYY
jgi:Zn-dependent protease